MFKLLSHNVCIDGRYKFKNIYIYENVVVSFLKTRDDSCGFVGFVALEMPPTLTPSDGLTLMMLLYFIARNAYTTTARNIL